MNNNNNKNPENFLQSAAKFIFKNEYPKQKRFEDSKSDSIFAEKRIYRRFYHNFPVIINHENKLISSHTSEISLIGFSCPLPLKLSEGEFVEVTIDLRMIRTDIPSFSFTYKAEVINSVSILTTPKDSLHTYKTFFPFNDEVKRFLNENTEFFKQKRTQNKFLNS